MVDLRLSFTQAGLDGTVPVCSKCIRNSDSRTVSIWISNFPYIEMNNFEAVTVSFGTLLCDGIAGKDGRMCVVRSVETLSDTSTAETILYLTVSVPSAPGGAVGPVTIQVRFSLHREWQVHYEQSIFGIVYLIFFNIIKQMHSESSFK
jgi:hypothetical protein